MEGSCGEASVEAHALLDCGLLLMRSVFSDRFAA
jgi:hypothetical protein